MHTAFFFSQEPIPLAFELLLSDTLPSGALSWAPLSLLLLLLLLLKHMRVTSTFKMLMNTPDGVIAAQDAATIARMCYSPGSFEKLLKCC